jgi:hypothetical protein
MNIDILSHLINLYMMIYIESDNNKGIYNFIIIIIRFNISILHSLEEGYKINKYLLLIYNNIKKKLSFK